MSNRNEFVLKCVHSYFSLSDKNIVKFARSECYISNILMPELYDVQQCVSYVQAICS
jgi:hypothetical protein